MDEMSDDGHLPPLTMSQENEIMRDLLQHNPPNQYGSDFEDIGLDLLVGLEENIDVAPYVCPADTVITQHGQAVQIKQEEPEAGSFPFTVATGKLPCREPFDGAYQFQLDVGALNTRSCLYSNKLNKLFTTVGSQCPMKFKWVGAEEENLFLRAVPLFLGAQDMLNPVTRCMYHASACKSIDNDVYSQHVVRALHEGARYQIDTESDRLSVIVPLDRLQPGSDSVTVLIAFGCKNSCPGGMNRRSTEIVFTLENSLGSVLGRASVQFRVCSCPKRDLEKEEREVPRTADKRSSQEAALQSAKRRMRVVIKEAPTRADGGELVYIPVLESMAPEIVRFALGLLLVKSEMPGAILTTQELKLKKRYLELLSSENLEVVGSQSKEP